MSTLQCRWSTPTLHRLSCRWLPRSTDFFQALTKRSQVSFKKDSSRFSSEALRGAEEQWSLPVLGHKAVLLPREGGGQGRAVHWGQEGTSWMCHLTHRLSLLMPAIPTASIADSWYSTSAKKASSLPTQTYARCTWLIILGEQRRSFRTGSYRHPESAGSVFRKPR